MYIFLVLQAFLVSSIRLYIHKLWLILKISISSKLFRVASCMLKDAVLLYNLDFIIIIIGYIL